MVNGWEFPNYAPDRNKSFTLVDAVALFSEEAICGNEGGRCIPSPAMLEWIDFINVASQGGVCEGMTVFSASRFLLQDSPETVDLSLNSVVSTGINRLFATQFIDDLIWHSINNQFIFFFFPRANIKMHCIISWHSKEETKLNL